MAKAKSTPAGKASYGNDASRGYVAPPMATNLIYTAKGSTGLRQYGGWVREEFLPQLVGRQAARVYREMSDNSPTVGAILFAIRQSMRQVDWRVQPKDETPECAAAAEFVESCMDDMSDSWSDFISETLSMLNYGFAPHEIIYKRRNGKKPTGKLPNGNTPAKSKYSDGLIGWKGLPLRGQDTVIKWFFADEGEITGLTQQPWFGGLLDIPIEKVLLFRPQAHKNNPEGYSILRTAYRPWYFLKRLEEQEAVYLERMSGVPEYRVPAELLNKANAGDAVAMAALEQYKKIIRNVRIDEQMGLITPSDPFKNPDGSYSSVLQYEFKYNVPQGGRTAANFDPSIERYKLDIMTSVLADFLTLGHSSRGTQSLAETKVDLFFQATEGWLGSNADVLNTHGLPRLFDLNGMDEDTLPSIVPDMPERVDLDGLSNFVLRLSQAGMTLFPDPETEDYLRDVSGLPELTEEHLKEIEQNPDPAAATEEVKKYMAAMLHRRLVRKGYWSPKTFRKSSKAR